MCTVSPLTQQGLQYYVEWYKNGKNIVDDRQLNLTNGYYVNILAEEDIGMVNFNDKVIVYFIIHFQWCTSAR